MTLVYHFDAHFTSEVTETQGLNVILPIIQLGRNRISFQAGSLALESGSS